MRSPFRRDIRIIPNPDEDHSMMSLRTIISVAAVLGVALSTACTRHVSHDIRDDGTAGQLVFPDPADAVLAEGTFPDVAHLRALGEKGATKDQLYQALGRPHFPAGFAGVREWDYLFHFRDGDRVATCQYKVIFDSSGHVGSSHWKPADCSVKGLQAVGMR